MEPADIKGSIVNIGGSIKDMALTSNVEDALTKALSAADKKDLILVTGSLFIIGEAKTYLAKKVPGNV